MKKFLTMFAFAAAIVFGAFALASCGGDDDSDNPSAIITYKIETSINSVSPIDMREDLKSIVNGVVLPTFTAPKNATAEELNEKVVQITKAANMETILKEKALAAGIKSYIISFSVVGVDALKGMPVSYSIKYVPARDAEDVAQLYTMQRPSLQTSTGLSKEADKDLGDISDKYKSKFSFTFTGKKEEAFNAMKEYLESDETKDFREALQNHINTYKDADLWYIAFVMKGENGLFTDFVYFGDKKK